MFRSQKAKRVFLSLFALAQVALVLPWFSIAPEITGYMWGWSLYFGSALIFPVIIALFFCLCYEGRHVALARGFVWLVLAVSLGATVWALGGWHAWGITGRFSFSYGLQTAHPLYWLSLGLTAAPVVAFPLCART